MGPDDTEYSRDLQISHLETVLQDARTRINALEAQLDALLVGLQVENTALLKTKGPEYFSKLAECIADDSQNKYAEIAALEAELEAVKADLKLRAESYDANSRGWQDDIKDLKSENKRLRLAAQAVVAAADRGDTDEVYRNMRGLRAALAGKEVR